MTEPFAPIVSNSILRIIGKPTVNEIASNYSASASFPRVTMHYHYVASVLYIYKLWIFPFTL